MDSCINILVANMGLSEFIGQVADMRQAQREYFSALRGGDELKIAKALSKSILFEIAVDATIREFRLRKQTAGL